MFNLYFTDNGRKDCTTVMLYVDTDLRIEKPALYFSWESGSAMFCKLLLQHLRKEFKHTIEQAHQLAYEQGYKDGKGKHRKKKNFLNHFSSTIVAY